MHRQGVVWEMLGCLPSALWRVPGVSARPETLRVSSTEHRRVRTNRAHSCMQQLPSARFCACTGTIAKLILRAPRAIPHASTPEFTKSRSERILSTPAHKCADSQFDNDTKRASAPICANHIQFAILGAPAPECTESRSECMESRSARNSGCTCA